MRCPTCHSEYEEGTSHNCPLKAAVLGSWGAAPTAVAPPPQRSGSDERVQLSANPAEGSPPQRSGVDERVQLSANPAESRVQQPPPHSDPEAGFDMRHHGYFDNPRPEMERSLPPQQAPVQQSMQQSQEMRALPPKQPSVQQSMEMPALPPTQSPVQPLPIVDEEREAEFHVEKQDDPNIGKLIGERYRIHGVVGRGGMGVVYKADHVTIDRPVAIKMLHPGTIADAEAIKRFKQEAQAVSKVEHQHVVRIYDFGMSDLGQPFIVMDFLDGRSLRDVIEDELLTITRAEEIFSQVVDALNVAHRNGVIHRDLKPANIMLSSKAGKPDWVSVVDFGISSFGGDEVGGSKRGVRGSPPYMSPEQCSKSDHIDHRTDVYSLALVLYEALSGRLPYNARNTFEWIDNHISGKPIPLQHAHASLSACEALTNVIAKALEKNPDKRFQTIEEFGSELKEAVRRDQIHQSFLKNRVDALGGSSSRLTALAPEDLYGQPASFDTSYAAIRAIKDPDAAAQAAAQPEHKFVFTNCPHCGEHVEADVAFCLGCGRTLASSQDFAKVRASQGVFTLPSGTTLSATIPAFSQKTKQKGGFLFALGSLNRALLLVSLVLAVFIFWYMGGVEWIAKSVLHQQTAVNKHE